MRGDRVLRFVTRTGRVILARPEEVRHVPPGEEMGVPEPGGQGADGHAIGHGNIGDRIDMPRLAAFVLLGVVCAFVITLAVAGVYRAGKWAFGEKRDKAAEVRVESGRRDMEPAASQRIVPPRAFSRAEAQGAVNGESYKEPVNQKAQPERGIGAGFPDVDSEVSEGRQSTPTNREAQARGEMTAYGGQSKKQEIHEISREPAVDYQSSIREMEKVLDSQEFEIKRLTESLRNMRKGDEGGR